jgi:hypothetical protein
MTDKKVNNWKAAEELQRFKVRYLDPVKASLAKAEEVFQDPEYKWKKGEKDRAKVKKAKLDTENIDYHRLYNAVMELIACHERQTDMLTEIYSKWYHNVSSEGKQPAEMMEMQAAILQEFFQRIYEAVEPLNLTLLPPQRMEQAV